MEKYTIGIDVGGTNVKLGLVNPSGKIISRTRFSTKAYIRNKSKLIDAMVRSTEDLIQENRLKKSNILGIGIGLPGLIDPKRGIVYHLPNISGWRNVPLKSIMKKKIGISTYVDNDVNMITLAEWRYGAGKGYKNFICITLGTGVGGGLILDNQLYRGEGFLAGEIGHIPHHDKMLESYVGNSVLQKKASKMFKTKNMHLEDVFALASKGNVCAIQFWQGVGVHIGIILAGVVNILNPRLIIIGGGVSNNFRFFGNTLKSTIQKRALNRSAGMVKVVRAKLGDDAGIKGAHLLVKESAIER